MLAALAAAVFHHSPQPRQATRNLRRDDYFSKALSGDALKIAEPILFDDIKAVLLDGQFAVGELVPPFDHQGVAPELVARGDVNFDDILHRC